MMIRHVTVRHVFPQRTGHVWKKWHICFMYSSRRVSWRRTARSAPAVAVMVDVDKETPVCVPQR
jgi:hypothetical protein